MSFKSRTQLMKEVPRVLTDMVGGDPLEYYLKAGSIDSIIDVYEDQVEEDIPEEPEPEPIEDDKPKKPKWQPKGWSVKYDVIIALHLKGMTNAAIAKQIKKSPNWISSVLNCDKSKDLIKEASRRIQEKAQTDIQNRVQGTADKALTIMDKVLTDEELLADHPLPLFDRAHKFAISAGIMRPTEGIDRSVTTNVDTMNVNQNNFNLPMNNDVMKGLMDALSKSDEVMARRSPLQAIASAGK